MARAGAARSSSDAVLYAASGLFAVVLVFVASVPQYREWGRIAAAPYAACAVGAMLVRRSGADRARVWLAVGAFAGAAILPMAVEVAWRSHTGPGLHAQSEVLITEEGAKAALDGRDPYAATYLHGSLAARPLGTKTHFPYLPGMLAFGLPRAADGRGPFADARLAFAIVSVGAFGLAWALGRMRTPQAVAAGQVLLALPTGALLLATGGDDVPVLALLLLAFVLLRAERPGAAGVAGGLAAATKQTAWLALPFLVLAAGSGRRRFLAAGAVPLGALVVPFVAWNPRAFLEDAVRFPLGLGRQTSAAGTPTLGSALVHAFHGERAVVVVLLVLLVGSLGAWLLSRPATRSSSGAAKNAGILFLAAIVLAPSARTGYLSYPVNLLVWATILGHDGRATVDVVQTFEEPS